MKIAEQLRIRSRLLIAIIAAAQQSDTGVTQTNEASQELARLGERLRELVSQFRV